MYQFDKLKMYFNEPYVIYSKYNVDGLKIFQPTIGDILIFGEKEFYSMLNVFVSNPTSYRLPLWKKGIDWTKISDYELFCMLITPLTSDDTRLLFGDLDFSLFSLYNDNNNSIVLYNQKQNITIDEETYKIIAEYLRLMFNIYPKVEKGKNKATKEAMIWEEEMNLANANKAENNSMLLPLVSACVNHPGFKYKLSELKEMGIVQFMDSVKRLQIYENTTALLKGMYSGMISSKDIRDDAVNFMKEI